MHDNVYFLVKLLFILQLDVPVDSYASLGGPVYQWLQLLDIIIIIITGTIININIFSRGECKNRTFPSSLVPLFQSESNCETCHMKMNSTCSFSFMQIKVIFIRMV